MRNDTRTLMCRVDATALSPAEDLERPLQPLEYLDLSSRTSQHSLFRPQIDADRGSILQENLSALSHAEMVKEVLVAWRGGMPRHLFKVIDPNTGDFVRMLDPRVPL